MDHTISDRDKDIKSQCVVSTIVVSDSYDTETSDTHVEFSNQIEIFSPETENSCLDAADIHLDEVDKEGNLDQEVVVEEHDAENFLSMQTLDDLDGVGSDDDIGI